MPTTNPKNPLPIAHSADTWPAHGSAERTRSTGREYSWRKTRPGRLFVTVIIDLTPSETGAGGRGCWTRCAATPWSVFQSCTNPRLSGVCTWPAGDTRIGPARSGQMARFPRQPLTPSEEGAKGCRVDRLGDSSRRSQGGSLGLAADGCEGFAGQVGFTGGVGVDGVGVDGVD